ncbi:MAG: META domain-containing protein [Acidimicrobiales bacterium]
MHSKRGAIIAPAVGLVIPVFAVSSSDDDRDGSSWQMTNLVVEDSMTPAVDGPSVTISFDDGTVQGFGGCNNYFGDYESAEGPLLFGDLFGRLATASGS